MKKYLNHKGFVILFTILISAIIMVIGLGIYSIATRETVLSGTAREAQYAFYAADAGAECALYAQYLDNTNGATHIVTTSQAPFDCGPSPVTIASNGTQFSFDMMVDTQRKTCAHVNIYDAGASRRVISQGYNICSTVGGVPTPIRSNPILVERDLDTTYLIAGGSASSATTTGP